jgi:hypothetical protein
MQVLLNFGVTSVLDKFPVTVDVSMEMAELPEQCALSLGIARIELPHLGIEQVVEEERTALGAILRRHIRIKAAPQLGFLS